MNPSQERKGDFRELWATDDLRKIQVMATKKIKKHLCARNIVKLLIIAAFVSVLDEVIMSLAQNTLHAKIALFPLENLTEMLPSVNKVK